MHVIQIILNVGINHVKRRNVRGLFFLLCGIFSLLGRREIAFDLRFNEDQLEPMFSGGTWAGTCVWSASLLLADSAHQALQHHRHGFSDPRSARRHPSHD